MQVQVVDQTTHPPKCHSFVGLDRQIGSSPPALLEREKKKNKERGEVLHLFRCHTHTHPRPEPVEPGQPWKARGRKRTDTDDGKQAETAQGGEGNERTSRTNLRGEMDLTKTEHTPKPHDTLRRGTRGELGTKWGTSWWRAWKTKTIN